MQIKFISIGLGVAALMAIVNAGKTIDVSNNNVLVTDVLNDLGYGITISDLLNYLDLNVASSKKRGLSMPKTVATALRRRAIARRGEEADEEEEDEDDNEDDEQDSTEEVDTEEESEAATEDDDESADNEEETTEDSEEDSESENSEWERRSQLLSGILDEQDGILSGL